MKFNRKTFFDGLRKMLAVRGRKLDQQTVDAVEFLLGAFENQTRLPIVEQQAYAWATIAHETAWTFRPIREYRARAGTAGRKNQDRYWLSGYYGRGYVQLTWQRNYADMSKRLGIDLVNKPDLALHAKTAFAILAEGMSKGTFTGKKIGDYVNAKKLDYVNARRVINGTDKAYMIAGLAREFEKILRGAIAAHAPVSTKGVAATVISTATDQVQSHAAAVFEHERESSGGTFTAYIPQIDTAKRMIKTLTGVSTLSAIGAVAADLPHWLIGLLVALVIAVIIGGVYIMVNYHREVFAYVTEMNKLRANPDMLDPELSSDL